MRAKQLLIITLALGMLMFHGCRKDPNDTGPSAQSPTSPFSLQIPSWVIDSGHPPALPSDDPLTVEGVALGRRLFHEKALSDNYTLSCASCHRQENAFSDPSQFSVGTNGSMGTRNSMAIVNLAWDDRFFWDGRTHSLEEQAFRPVVDHLEMRNTWPVVVERLQTHPEYPGLFKKAFGNSVIDSISVVKAIAQFERTLLSFNSRFDRFYYGGDSLALTEQEQRGLQLYFRDAHCVDCHKAPLMTDHGIRNNGLDLMFTDPGLGGVTGVAAQLGRFKTPTLRNIEVTAPYMHDGRFSTLEEVVDFYADDVELSSPYLDNHMFPWMMGQIQLSTDDREDLVAFLKTLTDHQFLTDPAFSAP